MPRRRSARFCLIWPARLDGVALRVPVVDGSLVDLGVLLDREVTVEEINEAFAAAAAEGPLAGRLRYEDEPFVSAT